MSRNYNSHVLQRITHLERNAGKNFQYYRKETIELNPVPKRHGDEIMEQNICKTMCLTGVNVSPEQLNLSHGLKKGNRVICQIQVSQAKTKCSSKSKKFKRQFSCFYLIMFLDQNYELAYRCAS